MGRSNEYLGPVLVSLLILCAPIQGISKSLWNDDNRSDYADNIGVSEGDILMVRVNESAQATAESDREREKDVNVGGESNANAPNSNIFNTLVDAIPLFGAGFTGNSDYNSEREMDADGSLNTDMSVRVVEKRNNGIIVLEGTRKLKLDDEIKELRFEGKARAGDVAPDNTIPSNRIADAKIFYEGKLGLADGEAKNVFSKGWLWVKNTLFY